MRAAIADLIAHGFIYRTRSHGANGAWAKYAVTWLPITRREGLFLGGFVACAWRDFEASGKKTSRQKMLEASGRKCSFIPKHPAENAGITPAKSAEYESIPCRGIVLQSSRGASPLSPWRKFRLTSRRVEISLPHPHQTADAPGKNQATPTETADGCTRIRDGEMLAACWDAAGKHLLHPGADTTARTFTIPANASVEYGLGTALSFVNQHGGGVITIAITTDTMRLAGSGTTGSRTLAANGMATAVKINATEWIISGVNLS